MERIKSSILLTLLVFSTKALAAAPQPISEWTDNSCHACHKVIAKYDALVDEYNSALHNNPRPDMSHLNFLRNEIHDKYRKASYCVRQYCKHQYSENDYTPVAAPVQTNVEPMQPAPVETHTRFVPQPVPKSRLALTHTGYEIGLMGGASYIHRSGQMTRVAADAPPGVNQVFSNSTTHTTPEVGFQLRSIFDLSGDGQPFFYLNASSTLGSTSSINMGAINPPSGLTSNIVLTNNWNVHVGFGVQTEPLFTNLQFGLGAGLAFLNQTIKQDIGETTTTSYQNQITNLRPSMMATASWMLCQDCVGGLPSYLAAQVTVDNYTSISVNGITPEGNTYHSTVNQQWVPHGDLLLTVGLG